MRTQITKTKKASNFTQTPKTESIVERDSHGAWHQQRDRRGEVGDHKPKLENQRLAPSGPVEDTLPQSLSLAAKSVGPHTRATAPSTPKPKPKRQKQRKLKTNQTTAFPRPPLHCSDRLDPPCGNKQKLYGPSNKKRRKRKKRTLLLLWFCCLQYEEEKEGCGVWIRREHRRGFHVCILRGVMRRLLIKCNFGIC